MYRWVDLVHFVYEIVEFTHRVRPYKENIVDVDESMVIKCSKGLLGKEIVFNVNHKAIIVGLS